MDERIKETKPLEVVWKSATTYIEHVLHHGALVTKAIIPARDWADEGGRSLRLDRTAAEQIVSGVRNK